MITDDDVRTAVETRWAAAAVLDALIPAATSVYADRIAEKAAWPAAAITVKEGEITRTGSAAYLRAFRLEVTVQDREDAHDEGAIRAALSGAFGGTAADATAGLSVSGATVLHCLEAAGGSKTEPVRIDGSDFLRLTATFDILVQGSN